ncbi:MAG: hypothetical protein ACJ76Z_12570 [Thermoleophilaceae bacterium]
MTLSDHQTTILNPPGANGGSDNVTFSTDHRSTRLIAYDSDASNLVASDTNGQRDVFVHVRSNPGANGDVDGTDLIASVANNGGPANGASENPNLDGDANSVPHCVVFQSAATNLAPQDANPDEDIFIRDLKRKTTKLVSFGLANAENATVDGECEFVAFDAAGSVYVRDLKKNKTLKIGAGVNPDQENNGRGVAFVRGGHIFYQAYVRKFRKKNNIIKFGRTIMVDRNKAGEAGNGTSANPVMDDAGYYVAFESTATNLCKPSACKGIGGEDRNGATSDIFRRTLPNPKAPTPDFMEMVSYSQGCSSSSPDSKSVDEQGNGPSNNPSMTGAGENIVFDSQADNLKEGAGINKADPNGREIRDIYYWNFPHGRKCGNISRESRNEDRRESGTGQPYNDNSQKPAASNRANFIGFTSEETGSSGEINGRVIPDVFVRFVEGGPGG